MPAHTSPFDACGPTVGIRRALPSDAEEFVALAGSSRAFVHPWITLPPDADLGEAYARRLRLESNFSVFVCEAWSGRMVGVINLSEIIRGVFQSACLGYWIGAPFARRGYMREG